MTIRLDYGMELIDKDLYGKHVIPDASKKFQGEIIIMALDWKQTSQWWYARYSRHGRTKLVRLKIKIQGKRPASISASGSGVDPVFVESRGRALQEHDRILAKIRDDHNLEDLTQKIIEIKTGSRARTVKLEDLPDSWEKIPRKRKPSATHAKTCKMVLQCFVNFMRDQYPDAKEMADVTAPMMQAFMDSEEKRGVSPRTWNMKLSLIRGVFKRLEPGADAYKNYLVGAPGKEEDTIHREPFTPEELKAILDATQEDILIRPVIVTALCTAMRRGDCCLLKWSAVDMKSGFITVKTGKTGDTVEIPILPMLNEEFKRLPRTKGEYVFPSVAEMYLKNPDGINWRLQQVLARAGFVDEKTAERIRNNAKSNLAVLPIETTRQKGLEAIAQTKMTASKRDRMRRIFEAYLNGRSIPAISAELGVSRGSASGLLNEIEGMIKAQIIRRPVLLQPSAIRGIIHANGNGKRLKLANVKGWHSFRTTWITLALSAGLPMELVRRVSGHSTADVVLKHYFRPGREQFRVALQAAMPKLLMNGAKSRDEQLREIIEGMTPKTLKKDKTRALNLLTTV